VSVGDTIDTIWIYPLKLILFISEYRTYKQGAAGCR